MAARTITINRAPVLTLWAAVVAERLGFDRGEALTLGRALAGLNAQSKGRALGIFHPPALERGRTAKPERGDEFRVELCGRPVPAMRTDEGVRAVVKGKPMTPGSVQAYLERSFGDELAAARKAMERLAGAYAPTRINEEAFGLYEAFRPQVARGTRGWGQKGTLDLDAIHKMTSKSE
jgi:hypothetical protein